MKKSKKILFIGIGFYDYDHAIILELEKLGFVVDYFCETPDNFSLRFNTRVNNEQKIEEIVRKHVLSIANNCGKNYDFVFVIKGNYISREAMEIIKRKNQSALFILYLWDSMKRIPNFSNISFFFHKIYSFDRMDCQENSSLIFEPLFYRNEYENIATIKSKFEYDLSFIGWYHSDRLRILKNIAQSLNQQDLTYYFKLYTGFFSFFIHTLFGGELKNNKEFLIFKPIKANESNSVIMKSSCILDIAHPLQSGLTIRTIEMLGAQKKLITTNNDIINYDFYNSKNIFVIDRESPVLDLDFFKLPIVPTHDDIRENYRLENWLKRLLTC